MEILDAGDREEREDGEEISFLDKLWSESEHEEGSAESWYQHWYTNTKWAQYQRHSMVFCELVFTTVGLVFIYH